MDEIVKRAEVSRGNFLGSVRVVFFGAPGAPTSCVGFCERKNTSTAFCSTQNVGSVPVTHADNTRNSINNEINNWYTHENKRAHIEYLLQLVTTRGDNRSPLANDPNNQLGVGEQGMGANPFRELHRHNDEPSST